MNSRKNYSLKPFYLAGLKGDLFTLHFQPSDENDKNRCVIVFPPFADEMNKSRRMMSMQCKRLAEAGYHVYYMDPYGTGDSKGDFADTSWQLWITDILGLLKILSAKKYDNYSGLALRSGALLAAEVLKQSTIPFHKLVCWQPVLKGEILLNQLLRLKLAGSMLGGAAEKDGITNLRNDLNAGKPVEIAGYTLSPDMYKQLLTSSLQELVNDKFPDIYWFELVSAEDKPLLPASRMLIEKLVKRGVTVSHDTMVGSHFWSTVELVDVPELLRLTDIVFTG